MTNARQLKANRLNAQASTGPKTRQGKRRSSKNARRHGLSLSVLSDPLLSQEAEQLAQQIAGEGARPALLEAARCVAEAQIDLARIRKARHDLVVRKLQDPDYSPDEPPSIIIQKIELLARLPATPELSRSEDALLNEPKGPAKFVAILSEIATKYAALDRYERRAFSRRKFAIREFDAIVEECALN